MMVMVALVLAACSTPVPTPSPTPTFEQKRTAVLSYLQSFDGIVNSLGDTVNTLYAGDKYLPRGTTERDLAVRRVDEQTLDVLMDERYVVALNGALARLANLQPSPLAPEEIPSHLYQPKIVFLAVRQAVDDLQKINRQREVDITVDNTAAWDEVYAAGGPESALNRATEQLLLKYNVSDAEVGYRFRGK